ncbi:MAG: BatD family protein [Granulosicoccus sp.]
MRQWLIGLCLLCSLEVYGQPVSPAGFGSSGKSGTVGGELIATLEADRTKAYVNEQILLTLTVGAPSIAFNITGDKLAVANVDVVQLSHQKSTMDINGRPHQFTKTVYALFAREAGSLQIPVLSFKAVLPVSAGGQMFGKGNPTISASTSALDLSIEPAPRTNTIWFPAQNVELESRWSVDITDSDAIRAGEPVTRHVSIKVSGQHPGAIPAFKAAMLEDIRTYPDLPRMETEVATTGLNGTLIQSYAMVASSPGRVNLPPMEIKWWNINERQWQTTTLAAEQLRISESTLDDMSMGGARIRHYQMALAAMAAALLGLAVFCLALWQRIRQQETRPAKKRKAMTEPVAWKALQRDLRNKDYDALRKSLVQWASLAYPGQSIQRLDQIPSAEAKMQDSLITLDAHLYGLNHDTAPDLVLMNRYLHAARKAARRKKTSHGNLTVLYPGP